MASLSLTALLFPLDFSEQLVLGAYKELSRRWDKDYDSFVLPLLDELQPCYILYRLDTQNAQGYEWLFISWSPDNSPVSLSIIFSKRNLLNFLLSATCNLGCCLFKAIIGN